MPVENEFRFVLVDDRGALRRALRAHRDVRELRIEQASLTKGTRLRRTEDLRTSGLTYEFTFKRRVGRHVVEIETEISRADFARLWTTRESEHAKTRYAFAEGELGWDIDYFGRPKNPYFVRAEVELPEGMWDETRVPAASPVIADYVLCVPGKDRAFTSGRLADEKYAVRLLDKLRRAARRADDGLVPECRLAFG